MAKIVLGLLYIGLEDKYFTAGQHVLHTSMVIMVIFIYMKDTRNRNTPSALEASTKPLGSPTLKSARETDSHCCTGNSASTWALSSTHLLVLSRLRTFSGDRY